MAVSICPSCHERFRYDSREELEVLAGDAAVINPDGGLLTFRSHQRVVHACPIRRSGLARNDENDGGPVRHAMTTHREGGR